MIRSGMRKCVEHVYNTTIGQTDVLLRLPGIIRGTPKFQPVTRWRALSPTLLLSILQRTDCPEAGTLSQCCLGNFCNYRWNYIMAKSFALTISNNEILVTADSLVETVPETMKCKPTLLSILTVNITFHTRCSIFC